MIIFIASNHPMRCRPIRKLRHRFNILNLLEGMDGDFLRVQDRLISLSNDIQVSLLSIMNLSVQPTLLTSFTYKLLDPVLLVELRERLMNAENSGQRATISIDEMASHLSLFDVALKDD